MFTAARMACGNHDESSSGEAQWFFPGHDHLTLLKPIVCVNVGITNRTQLQLECPGHGDQRVTASSFDSTGVSQIQDRVIRATLHDLVGLGKTHEKRASRTTRKKFSSS